jgi:hypothetical protein
MRTQILAASALVTTLVMSSSAHAAECAVDVLDPFDLEGEQIDAIYECIGDKMVEGYSKQGDEIATSYRDWTVTSTRPAVAGPHGNRLLQTFANDIAVEEYLKFAEEGVVMPVGSVLAKESIRIHKKKEQAVVGPLFIMTKVEAGSVPETNDWVYSGLQPNGKPMKFKQAFCHDCHTGWAEQDYLAYPLEDVRVSN